MLSPFKVKIRKYHGAETYVCAQKQKNPNNPKTKKPTEIYTIILNTNMSILKTKNVVYYFICHYRFASLDLIFFAPGIISRNTITNWTRSLQRKKIADASSSLVSENPEKMPSWQRYTRDPSNVTDFPTSDTLFQQVMWWVTYHIPFLSSLEK